jgi:anti-sigma-K factor RskA
MRDLAPTTGAQVYEAWLIAADGAPIPIGGFQVGADGSAAFVSTHAPLGAGVTVALTLEPGPGATTPTVPIIAQGQAAQSS